MPLAVFDIVLIGGLKLTKFHIPKLQRMDAREVFSEDREEDERDQLRLCRGVSLGECPLMLPNAV